MAIEEVTAWQAVPADNIAHHPTGPQGSDAVRISSSFRELQAAIARWRDTLGGGTPPQLIFTTEEIAEDTLPMERWVVDTANADHDWYISRGIQRVGTTWELGKANTSPTGIFFNGDATQNGLVVVAAGNHNSLAAGANVGRPEDFPAVLELSGLSGIARISTNGTTRLTVNDTEVIVRDQLRMSASGSPIIAAAATTAGGGIRIPHGVAPTTPVDGDFWSTTAGFFARVNGGTVGPFTAGGASISGTPVNNQAAFWVDANTLEGEPDISYDQTTFTLANHTAMQLPSGYRIQFANANFHINGQASKIQVAGTNFETQFDATIGAGGVGTSQLNINANATGTTYLNFKQNGVIKGFLAYENTGAQMHLDSDGQIVISPNNTTAVTLATTGAATFAKTIIAPASTTSIPSLRLPHGVDPTVPVDGDIWTKTTGVFARVNGVTQQLDIGGGSSSTVIGTAPFFGWQETDGALDQERWRLTATGETLQGSIHDDAEANSKNWMVVQRSGTGVNVNVDSVQFLAGVTESMLFNSSGLDIDANQLQLGTTAAHQATFTNVSGLGSITLTIENGGNFQILDGNTANTLRYDFDVDTGNLQMDGNLDLAFIDGYGGTPVDGEILSWNTTNGRAEFANQTLYVAKPADESVTNSTTLQDDDDLQISLAANAEYAIEGRLWVESASSTPDFKFDVVEADGTWTGWLTTPTADNRFYQASSSGSFTIIGTIPEFMSFSIIIATAGAGGTFKVQWAQNVLDAVNAVTVKKGSWMSARRLD